ncbi:hypothetical protein [Polynucleobacter sp. AP-Latsch-80-C2]|jgi:hypothetical protein|uniref:hypothetical protein n=1 Tax=Polynucleobacter sp. AP-Latsch-80-C2 TaxID=2576931 RepID=UPI001C0B4A2C|nr:hypothetical protein [Polynucleobacter sp. AP-Latsch-80-C2]MBU3623838.1 hypothetical protein [Polynucleobacter sp. AP-Latsch-80-C2]
MLSDDKKALIEAEERYRQELNKKLSADLSATKKDVHNLGKDLWAKVSEVLNSNFGIWFLSSVFLSGGAALYQVTQHHYETSIAKEKEIVACEFEIVNRLNHMRFLLRRATTVADAKYALTPVSKSLGAITADYENVNIAVLYFKIYQLTGVRDKRITLYIKDLEEKNLAIQAGNPKENFSEKDRKELLEIINTLDQYEIDQINSRKN